MLDPSATYRAAQVTTVSPVGQVVLLYQGAIRFGSQHVAFLANGQIEQAHRASIRCQEIVSALRSSLDLSVGPVADQLDQLYAFVLRRLVDGNLSKTPRPTEEALQVLRGLLEAWQEIAAHPSDRAGEGAVLAPIPMAVAPAAAQPRIAAGALR